MKFKTYPTLGLLTLGLLFSCTQFVQMTDDEYFEEVKGGKDNSFSLIFSNNINGETHPCGCRKFPLGGLPQVNGLIENEKKSAPVIYVDSGDTFFASTIVPDYIKSSSTFTAGKIAEALDKLDLKFITPGDQDFSLGEEFLVNLANKHKFKFLISNSSSLMKIKHKKWGYIKAGETNLFFLGVVDPSLLNAEHRRLFTPPHQSIDSTIKAIEKKFKDKKNKKFILLSHSGLDMDKKYANSFPKLNWIIGAHSQSFLQYTVDVNKTKIVQALSRNHYLGKIKMPLNAQGKETYKLLESRDETKDLIKNNEFKPWLVNYKAQLDKIQESEQGFISGPDSHNYATYLSCSECHDKQTEFWQGTSHSIAFKTLVDAKAANNSSCIGCHSLGYKEDKGFISAKSIVKSEKKDFDIDKYWSEFSNKVKTKKSIRYLKPKERKMASDAWIELDQKHEVARNFSNVQCLHCHSQSIDHPFDSEQKTATMDFTKSCTECHTKDQSPEWYSKDSKGLATSLNKKYFAKKLKEVSCPKIER